MVNVALVGCGHMGARHAAVIASHPQCALVAAIDVRPERAAAIAAATGAEVSQAVPHGVDAVVVATPTTTHAQIAGPLLDQGAWCLVEKPLAHSRPAAQSLDRARCIVGHIERFNPALRAAGSLRPTVVEARRVAPPTGRGGDVDVVLDLMIHDLDLVLGWMAPGAEVAWLDAVGVGPRIDTASVRLRSTCGLTATLLASRAAGRQERRIECFAPGRTVSLDLLLGTATVSGQTATPRDGRDALTAQWEAFVGKIKGEERGAVAGDTGVGAVALAEQIGTAIREQR